MTHKTFITAIAFAVGLAAAATLSALGAAPVAHHPVRSAYSARALKALDDRWNAEAKYFRSGER
jgi:hypothetical protein